MNFDDVSKSFASKSNYEILRALIVFRLCALKALVKNARTLLKLSDTVFGKRFTAFLLKKTFFAHFCAGENGDEIRPVIEKLKKCGVGSILDYAAEADVEPHQRRNEEREGVQSARIFDYESESVCDENTKLSLKAIDASNKGFVAIKVTALGKPEFLERMSVVLTDTKRLFRQFALQNMLQNKRKSDSQTGVQHSSSEIDFVAMKITYEMFERGLKEINVHLPREKVKHLFDKIDTDGSRQIDYIEWITFLSPQSLGGLNPKFKSKGLEKLSQEELDLMNAMIARLERLASRAAEKSVKLMVDAEQTYFQPAIDHLVLHLQRLYNQKEPLIYNTYQCYLKDTHSRILVDLERSKRECFYFAAKIVRGAYMVQERKRAQMLNIEDPIQPNIQATHANYHQIIQLLLDEDRCALMVASHNEETAKLVVKLMNERQIAKDSVRVVFGQLLGMCDHVSFGLAAAGFQVYKYVPYGPIREVIPYLLRRAEENSDLLGGPTKERKLLKNELLRRTLPFVAKKTEQFTPKQNTHNPTSAPRDYKTTA